MTNKSIIRPFVQSDGEQISDILQKTGWANQYIDGQKRAIQKLLLDEEGEVFVVAIADLVVGYISVQHHKWNRLSYVHGLVVSSIYHKQGIAKKLLEHVEVQAKVRSNRGVYLDTPVDNFGARAFYESTKYVESYIIPEFYRAGLDGVAYMKLFDQGKNF